MPHPEQVNAIRIIREIEVHFRTSEYGSNEMIVAFSRVLRRLSASPLTVPQSYEKYGQVIVVNCPTFQIIFGPNLMSIADTSAGAGNTRCYLCSISILMMEMDLSIAVQNQPTRNRKYTLPLTRPLANSLWSVIAYYLLHTDHELGSAHSIPRYYNMDPPADPN